jgi:hypothetical protein
MVTSDEAIELALLEGDTCSKTTEWNGIFNGSTLDKDLLKRDVAGGDRDRLVDLISAFADRVSNTEAALVGVAENKKWLCGTRDVSNMEMFKPYLEKGGSVDTLRTVNLYEMTSLFLRLYSEKAQGRAVAGDKKAGYGFKVSEASSDRRRVDPDGGDAGANASPSSSGSGIGNSTARSAGTSLANVFDMFLALLQKLGVWVYNLVPNLDVTLPAFMTSMNWLKFPSIGWELALELPDLQKRGWLYWLIFLGGIAAPFYITYIIVTDTGKQPEYAVKESPFTDAEDFIAYEAWRTKKITAGILTLGLILAIFGGVHGQGELLGFGCLVLLVAVWYYAWAYLKAQLLEMELATHNRKLDSAYRGMRVFVCSTILLLALRSIYIMTISAVALTVIETLNNPSRVGELCVAIILLPFAYMVFPLYVYYRGLEFQNQYLEKLSDDVKCDPVKFRGWMERFSLRETDASMADMVIAALLLPFKVEMYNFAAIQLIERGTATMCAVLATDSITGQLAGAISIEGFIGCYEFFASPFVNDVEGKYNIVWRGLASLILFMYLLVELIGDPFAGAADALILFFTLVAVVLFVYAIDIPRIYRVIVRQSAISNLRSATVDDGSQRLGELGVHGPIDGGRSVALALNVALQKIPASVDPAEVFRDAFSYVQQYRFLALADDDPDVLFLVLYHGLLTKVEPLLSLGGCRLGGHIPLSVGAFMHVQRLVLSDMGLDDTSSLAPLSTLRNLEYLDLDRNQFKHRVQGLELLGGTTKLNTFSMQYCLDWEDDEEGSLFNKQLTELPLLRVLNLQTESTDKCFKAPISYEFLKVLYKLESFTQPAESDSPYTKRMSVGDIRNYSFKLDQYYRGKVPLLALITESEFDVTEHESLERLLVAGYPLEELRIAGFGIGVVKDCNTYLRGHGAPAHIQSMGPKERVTAVKKILSALLLPNLKRAGYTISECFNEGAYTLFMLEEAKFSYLDMVRELGVRISDPPLNVTIFKLRDAGELSHFNVKDYCNAGFDSGMVSASGFDMSEFSFTLSELQSFEKE